MTGRAQALDSSNRRGHRLRRFLERALIFMVALAASRAIGHAQPDAPETLHVAHLHGVYVSPKGAPIRGADVTIQQNGKVVASTRTDASGRFALKHLSGHYRLHVNIEGYSIVDRDIIIGLEALMYLRASSLFIIAGPAACTDDCSSIFTSKDDFNRQLKHNAGHYD